MFNNRVPHILDGDHAPLSAEHFREGSRYCAETGMDDFPVTIIGGGTSAIPQCGSSGARNGRRSAVIKVFQKLAGIDLPESKRN